MQPNNQNQPVKSVDGISPPRQNDSANNPGNHAAANSMTPKTEAVTVIKSGNSKVNNSALLTVILTALLLIVLVGGMYAVYNWQHKKVNDLDTKVSNLNSQVQTLQQKANNSSSAGSSTTSTAAQYTFNIAPLGIQFTVPPILADLTYVANSNNDTANISSQSLEAIASSCEPNASTGSALGDIIKETGQFQTNSTSTLIKQYSTYYVAYAKAASSCSTDSSVNSLITTLTTDLVSTFSSIQTSSQS